VKVYLLIITVIMLTFFWDLSAQVTQYPQNPVNSSAGLQCSGGEIHDLGVVGSNLGWNTAATSPVGACLKFVPPVYPFRYSKFCMNFSRLSTGTVNWNFKIYMWKSVNGKPGPRMDSVNVTATPGILPAWAWYDFPLPATWKEVTGSDSVFIGFLYDAQTYLGGSFAMDCSASLPVWPGYTTQGAVIWNFVSTPTYKSWLMRAEGAPSVAYAHDISAVDFLNIPPYWKKDSTYNVKAKIKNTGSSSESNVPVKFFVNGVLTGTPINVSLAPGAVDSVSFQWTPTGAGANNLKIVSSLPTDEYKLNDTLSVNLRVIQFPMYYNYLDGTASNSFPFAMQTGKAVNTIFLSGEFSNPSPVPTGKSINKIYFHITAGIPTVYNNLIILLAQSTITSLGTAFYPGPYDTVYNHSSATTSAITADMFLSFTLDHPFPYDPTKSLIMFVGQCGSTTTGYSIKTTTLFGNTRVYSVGGCPFVYNGLSGIKDNIGFDIVVPTSVTNDPVIPSKYSLEQNYPNPFNPVTNIRYNLPKNSFVTLKIYDIMGREVQTLVNENKNSGTYEARFDASNLPSGMYFCKMTAGDFSAQNKMLLIK